MNNSDLTSSEKPQNISIREFFVEFWWGGSIEEDNESKGQANWPSMGLREGALKDECMKIKLILSTHR